MNERRPAVARGRAMMRLGAISLLAMVMLVTTVVVALVASRMPTNDGFDPWFVGILFAGLWLYWGLGALIIIRTGGHMVGWLFTVAAAMMATVFGCFALRAILIVSQPPDPLAAWVSLVGGQLFFPAIILILPAVALVFPTGTLPSPRWKGAVQIIAALVVVQMLAHMIQPGPMGDGPVNPLTPWLPVFPPSVVDLLRLLQAIGSLALPLGAGLGVTAIAVRFRRSEGDVRQQLKWLIAATVPAAVLIPLSVAGFIDSAPILETLSVGTLPLIAIAIGIAITRYRLYEIDRIVSRTIGYGLVTAVLFTLFWTVNLGLQGILSAATRSDPLVVAGSTLLVAALFNPLRIRVQRVVDRRFNRARYDAEQTVERFASRLRDQLDLPTLTGELQRTSVSAVEPATSAVWLRAGGTR